MAGGLELTRPEAAGSRATEESPGESLRRQGERSSQETRVRSWADGRGGPLEKGGTDGSESGSDGGGFLHQKKKGMRVGRGRRRRGC